MYVKVNNAGFMSIPLNWSLTSERTRAWPDMDLWFLIEGHGQVESSQGIFPLLPGACLIMKGGEDYTFTVDKSLPCRHYYIHFDYIAENEEIIPPMSVSIPTFYRIIESQHFVELILQRLVSAKNKKDNPTVANKWLAAVLEEIHRQDERDRIKEHAKNNQLMYEFETLCNDIRQHPERQWIVEHMAEKIMMSRSHFYRLFSEKYKRSPNSLYLRNACVLPAAFYVTALIQSVQLRSFSVIAMFISSPASLKNLTVFHRDNFVTLIFPNRFTINNAHMIS